MQKIDRRNYGRFQIKSCVSRKTNILLIKLTDPEYTNFCGSTDNSSLACLSLTCLNVPTMDVCSGSLLFSLVLMSTVFSSRLRLLLTYVSPSDNCIEIEAGIARTLQFPVLKYIYVQIIVMGLPIQNFGFFES